MSWSTSELRGWGWRHGTGLSPPVKYFYWPFQGGTSLVGECSGSVVKCLTRRRAAGWSLTGVTALWSLSKTHLSLLSTGSTQEDPSLFNWKIVDGTKRIKSNKQTKLLLWIIDALWSPSGKVLTFALVCDVSLWVCYFPIGILGQVCYLIVSIDLCALPYFENLP